MASDIFTKLAISEGKVHHIAPEDVEFHDPPDLPDTRVLRGRDAVAAHLANQAEVIGEMKFTIVDVEERGRSVMLRMTLGRPDDADLLEQAVDTALAAGARTADIAESGAARLSTQQMGDAVLNALEQVFSRQREHA